MKKINYVIILLIIVVVLEGILYIQLYSNHNILYNEQQKLKEELFSLQSLYDGLNITYYSLSDDNQELQEQHNSLSQSYSSLQSNYNNLQTSYTGLQNSYNWLQGSYDDLEQSYVTLLKEYQIETYLRIGNSLVSYYDLLRQELGTTGTTRWWTYSESYWQAAADFAAELALHDLRILYWQWIEDDYYEDVGEYSYDTARAKIDEIITLLEIDTYDTSVDIIEKVLTFINSYIHYEYEINDVFHAPVETLGFKSGDCDDFTILAAALFEDLGIESAIGFYYNEIYGYHTMVLVHLENLGGYGYWYFSDLTHRGLEEGSWITIEPQLIIECQDSDWIEQWDLLVASPLDFEP